jgi:putative toxin-antitoxin system antitoxin component (TIGR02293 family)
MATAAAPVESVVSAARVLGGRAVLGRVLSRREQVIDLVREGIPVEALERVSDALGTSDLRVADLLGVSARTLARRKRERDGVLDESASDRLFRLAGVLARAEEALGDRARAVRWLAAPNRALGGSVPLDLLDTDLGTRAVEAVLGRIESGVYS